MRPKDQGTRFESQLVRLATDYGLEAERLAEGGQNDLGDLRIEGWIIEAKHRANLNIHDALRKALKKSGNRRTVVAWKRLVRRGGNTRRAPAGEPVIVAMALGTFLDLLAAQNAQRGPSDAPERPEGGGGRPKGRRPCMDHGCSDCYEFGGHE